MSAFIGYHSRLLSLLAACLLWISPVQAADVMEEFQSGSWTGWAYSEEGMFSYCLVAREAPGRRALILVRAVSTGYALAIYDEQGPYRGTTAYSTITTIDKRWRFETQGVVAERQLLRMPLPRSEAEAALEHMAAGNRLQVSVNGVRKINLSLSGSRRAIERLQRCYDTYAPASVPDVDVVPSQALRELAAKVYIDPPSGSMAALRDQADDLDATALIRLGLALADYPQMMQYEDEGAALIAMTADAGDIRGLFVLASLMKMGLTSESYPGHADELISEAADGGLDEALYQRALSRRATAPEDAYYDALQASQLGHAQAGELVAAWDKETGTAPVPQPAKPPASSKPAPIPPPPAPAPPASTPPAPAPAQAQTETVIHPVVPGFAPGEPIIVRYQGLPQTGVNWIAISKPDRAPDSYLDLQLLPEGTSAGEHSFAPQPPGTYELRVYLDWPKGGYDVAARQVVTVAAQQPAPPAPGQPQDADPVEYRLLGNMACFGAAEYPEAWRGQFECKTGGCFVGTEVLDDCLLTADSLGAKLVLHGKPEGLWPNECWVQNSCSDLREHPDFNTYERVSIAVPPSPMENGGATPPPSPMDSAAVSPPPSPMQSDPDPAAPSEPDADLVFAIHTLLVAAGYATGDQTGTVTPELVAAIRAFQQDQGLPVDGQPTEAVRDELVAAIAQKPPATAPQPAATQPPASPPPATQPATNPEPGGAGAAGYIPPRCKDSHDNYTVDLAEAPGHSCYLIPPQTFHISPGDQRLVTCGQAHMHVDKSTRTLSKCRADFGATFTMEIQDGQATCFEADFHENGKLSRCEHEFGYPVIEVQTMGQTFVCMSATFDEEERLLQCQGSDTGGGSVSVETGYGVPATCSSHDYHAITFENGVIQSCWLAEDFEPETEDLRISCKAGRQLRFDEAARVVEVDLRDCDKVLKSAVGEPTATMRRPHPRPGPTDLKAMPMCNRTSKQCSLKEPRWIAIGPDGQEQVLCRGHIELHDNPGYLKECPTLEPVTFQMHGTQITCNEFQLGADGMVTYCEGNDDGLPSFAATHQGAEVLCRLDDRRKRIEFWPGGQLKSCVPEKVAILTAGTEGHSLSCAPDEKLRFWPGGGVEMCAAAQPATVPGPFGGAATCTPGEIRLLPDGSLRHCVMEDGQSLPVELPDGQQAACLKELEMHVVKDKETGAATTITFGACEEFDRTVTLTAGETAIACFGAAYHPPRKGGGLYACITTEVDRFEVNHDYQPECPRPDAIAVTFKAETGAIDTVHQCQGGG